MVPLLQQPPLFSYGGAIKEGGCSSPKGGRLLQFNLKRGVVTTAHDLTLLLRPVLPLSLSLPPSHVLPTIA